MLTEPLKVDWSFKGLTGKFTELHFKEGFRFTKFVPMSFDAISKLILASQVVREFSEQEVKAIAASVEITDGPDDQGEMFTRPGRPADKFKNPYPNVKASIAANGGAYPPDMSVLVKARPGVLTIFIQFSRYEDPPAGVTLVMVFITINI